MEFFLSLPYCIEFEEQFEVDLVGKEVVLGRTLVTLQEGVICAIPFHLIGPGWLLLHVDIFRVKQLLQVVLLEVL